MFGDYLRDNQAMNRFDIEPPGLPVSMDPPWLDAK